MVKKKLWGITQQSKAPNQVLQIKCALSKDVIYVTLIHVIYFIVFQKKLQIYWIMKMIRIYFLHDKNYL